MAADSPIEWLRGRDGRKGASWNFVRGCTRKSPGCGGPGPQGGCYAEAIAARFSDPGMWGHGYAERTPNGPRWTGKLGLVEHLVGQPLRWRRPRKIFVNSTSDLFHEKMPWDWLFPAFAVMCEAPQHVYIALTKRPDVMADFAEHWLAGQRLAGMTEPPAHIWLGCSVENQEWADKRRGHMERIAAAGWNIFVSYEPALEHVDWDGWEFLRWLISGDESGAQRRAAQEVWHTAARNWCVANGIPYFLKQRVIGGEMESLPELDGQRYDGFPEAMAA